MIEKELVAASPEPLILPLLTKGERYGYELIQEIKHLKKKREQWTVISTVLGGLWKGQYV